MQVSYRDPITPEPGEEPADLAARVQEAMSSRAEALTRGRVPVLGWRVPWLR